MEPLILQNQLIAVMKQVSDMCLELKYSREVNCWDELLELALEIQDALREIEESIKEDL